MGMELNFSVVNIWEVIVAILTFTIIMGGILTINNEEYISASLFSSEISLISSHLTPGSEVSYNIDSEKYLITSSGNIINVNTDKTSIQTSYRNPSVSINQERYTLIIS